MMTLPQCQDASRRGLVGVLSTDTRRQRSRDRRKWKAKRDVMKGGAWEPGSMISKLLEARYDEVEWEALNVVKRR